jgi:transposase
MEHSDAPLPDDLETCHRLIRELLESLRQQILLNEKLQHQLEQLLRRIYGRKSEKLDPSQLLLFAREILEATGIEVPATDTAASADTPAPAGMAAPEAQPATAPKPKKKGHGRRPLPPCLPRDRVVHDVPTEQRVCPDCGAQRCCIGEEVHEQLEYKPASLVVLEHVRMKYACPDCQGNVVIAERLPEPIEKGRPGTGLLSYIIISKYADHLPLYRLEGIFRRQEVELSRQTMCDWMALCAELLEPIYKVMHRQVLESKVIGTDDTTVPVQDPGSGKTRTGRLWLYRGDRDHPGLVFDYTPDHSGDGPERMLKGYRGYLQADAYSAYDAIYADSQVLEVGCWAHARRKFDEAKTSDPIRAHVALAWIQGLYQVEREAKELDDAAREALRRQRSRPILEEIHAWLIKEKDRVLPKSPIGEAIGYALNHWTALERYLEAGYLSIDNNAVENGLRPVALGRKNWLNVGSDKGGKTAAILISLTATCKALGIDPYAYLKDVLERISTHPYNRIKELLPEEWKKLRVAAEARDPGG